MYRRMCVLLIGMRARSLAREPHDREVGRIQEPGAVERAAERREERARAIDETETAALFQIAKRAGQRCPGQGVFVGIIVAAYDPDAHETSEHRTTETTSNPRNTHGTSSERAALVTPAFRYRAIGDAGTWLSRTIAA
jgi:hypothetical protein